MADRIFDIQSFTGWEADNIYKWPENSFYSSDWIEVRKDLSYATLSSKHVDTGWTVSGNITCIANLSELGIAWGGIVICTSSGNVYLNGVLKNTFTSNTRVDWIGVMTNSTGSQFVYYYSTPVAGAWVIHRSTSSLSTFIQGHRSYAATGTIYNDNSIIQIINNNGLLYATICNCIVELDKTEVVSNALILPTEESIYGFTQFQNNFKIYTNLGNSWVQYFWDGEANLPYYRQLWNNQRVLWVVNDGGLDYAILWYDRYYSDLYLIQGTQKSELRVNQENTSWARFFRGNISIREGIVYISGGRSWAWEEGVYTYGNYYPGTNKSLSRIINDSDIILLHAHDSQYSYFTTATNNKIYKIEHGVVPSNLGYVSTGNLQTLMINGQMIEEFSIKKIKIAYKLKTGTSIGVYIRKDESASFSLIKTLDFATYGGKKSYTIVQQEISSANLWNMEEFQIKLVLNAWSNWSIYAYTPSVGRVVAYADIVNDQ